jgi:hypothetical protein
MTKGFGKMTLVGKTAKQGNFRKCNIRFGNLASGKFDSQTAQVIADH